MELNDLTQILCFRDLCRLLFLVFYFMFLLVAVSVGLNEITQFVKRKHAQLNLDTSVSSLWPPKVNSIHFSTRR